MKRLIYLLFFLLPGICYSQHLVPEKGDNIIIIKTTESPDIAYLKMADLLYFSGLGLTYSDRDLMMLSVHGEMVIFNSQLFIKIVQGDKTEIYIHGLYEVTDWGRISFRGGKESNHMRVWGECVSIAEKYKGGEILFDKLDLN